MDKLTEAQRREYKTLDRGRGILMSVSMIVACTGAYAQFGPWVALMLGGVILSAYAMEPVNEFDLQRHEYLTLNNGDRPHGR